MVKPTPRRSRPSWDLRWTRRRAVLVATPFLLVAAMYLIATIDLRRHDGQVLRSVELAGVDVGGLTPVELDEEMQRINSFVATAPVYINTNDVLYEIPAEALGLQLDFEATRAAVLSAGRDNSAFTQPFEWFGALRSPRQVQAIVELDTNAAEEGLLAVSRTIGQPPGDPTLALMNGRLELVPGEPGRILDVSRLLQDLGASLPAEPGSPIEVNAFTTPDAQIDRSIRDLVDEINGATTQPIPLFLDGMPLPMPSEVFRSLISLELATPVPMLRLDESALYEWVNDASGIAQGEIDTQTLIVEGDQIRLPAVNAALCCSIETADDVLSAVLQRDPTIELGVIRDDLTPLVNIGIAELVGEFTTNHPSGQDRVINIQRMADIVRGAVIEPGGEFSLNDFVGQRTAARGFVPAGVIYDGVFTEDVGGGVSQFATTLFNAAFFSGLDLLDYQSHSIYIDRYPYGREATVNWPGVDLRIGNPTEFPILIWTEYTPDSITVKLFGTAVVSAEQTGQRTESVGECTRVITERTRRFVGGEAEVDTVSALYQPEEGLGCDGLPTVPPPDCADDEGLVDTDENGFGDACAPLSELCPANTVAVDEDGDRIIDFCDATECPAGTFAADSDGDGVGDLCVSLQPTVAPPPDSTPEPDPEATPDPEPTVEPEPTAETDG